LADAPHRKTTASHKRVGSVVRGKYRVDAFLATGTMANVYSATHRNGSKVALKILHPQLAADPALVERFKREGYFANSIGHPGIVRAIDDDETEDGCTFLVMELLEGESLDERRRRKGGKLPLDYVLPVADSLLEILAAAHAREVVHRDLKPDNVFVTKDGDVKVLDFGLARWNDGKSSSDMTGVGMVLGTPAYMPPEQALGRREDVDAQSDLWAVGATLFVVLSGEPVHAGGDAKAKLIATARTAARPLQDAAPDVPRAVAQVIDRALAFHKKDRWADAEAMREALKWARMSLEDAPAKLAGSRVYDVAEPSAPPPTRRGDDDEPTVMRIALGDEMLSRLAGKGGVAPESRDFLTSAPPITLRDVPKPPAIDPAATLSNNEPVFSLRREKDESRESPSTERLPMGGALTPASPVAHASTMPIYDPSAADAMGTDLAASSAGEEAGSSTGRGNSIDVNLSFTRPMAAMVMPPDYEAPRPAAGTPAVDPSNSPAPSPESPPGGMQPPAAFPSPSAFPVAPPAYPTVPPMHVTSPPGAAFPQMQTAPSLRVQSQVAIRPSLPPEAPGPLLSQIVKPGLGRAMRIIVVLGVLLVGGIVVAGVLRTRSANARAAALAASAASASAVSGGEPASPTTASGAPSADTPPGVPPGGPPAATTAATTAATPPEGDPKVAAVAATPSATATEPKRPRPRPRRPKIPPRVTVTEPTPEATAAPPASTQPPAVTPPSDPTALPTKDPEPKPPDL
jgi:serine/threonine-protein kinase